MKERARRGWGAFFALAFAVYTFSVTGDALPLLGLPLAVTLVALPPRRPAHLLLATLALLFGLAGAPRDSLWQLSRGWALLLGAWFVVGLLLVPRATLTGRALLATAASALTAALLMLVRPGAMQGVDLALASQLRSLAQQNLAVWRATGAKLPPELVDTMNRLPDIGSFLAPALMGLASMAALGVAWWVYRRLVVGDQPPLAPLREFRFRDDLVWLLVAGIVLVLVPWIGHGAMRAGSNIVMFMGALYALRGLAVLVALAGGALGFGGALLALLAALSILPLATAATALVGLTDTWLDIRARMAAPPGPAK